MAAVTICLILEAKKIKSVTVSVVYPSIFHEVMGLDAMMLIFWLLSFNPAFSLPSFTFIKKFFSYSLSAIRVVSSAYLRLLIFLPAILIPACASFSPVFLIMYSAAGGQHEESRPWQSHAEGSLTKCKDVIRLQGFPLEFPEHPPPKTRVCLLYCYAFHLLFCC